MSLRDAFLTALAENENDTTTRLVFADWLDEQGEHEEADRQRKWPAAKEWLLRACEASADPDSESRACSYEELLAFGRGVVAEETYTVIFLTDDDSEVESAIGGNFEEYFQNWSIVTGIPLPPHLERKSFYSQCCPGEESWIGGVGPPKEEEDSSSFDEWDGVEDEFADRPRKSSAGGAGSQGSHPQRRKKRKQ